MTGWSDHPLTRARRRPGAPRGRAAGAARPDARLLRATCRGPSRRRGIIAAWRGRHAADDLVVPDRRLREIASATTRAAPGRSSRPTRCSPTAFAAIPSRRRFRAASRSRSSTSAWSPPSRDRRRRASRRLHRRSRRPHPHDRQSRPEGARRPSLCTLDQSRRPDPARDQRGLGQRALCQRHQPSAWARRRRHCRGR